MMSTWNQEGFETLLRLSRCPCRMKKGLSASSVKGGPQVYFWKFSNGITKDRNADSRTAPFSHVSTRMVAQRSSCGPVRSGGGASPPPPPCAARGISARGWYLLGYSPCGGVCGFWLVTPIDRQSRRRGVRDCRCDSGTARGGGCGALRGPIDSTHVSDGSFLYRRWGCRFRCHRRLFLTPHPDRLS